MSLHVCICAKGGPAIGKSSPMMIKGSAAAAGRTFMCCSSCGTLASARAGAAGGTGTSPLISSVSSA